MASTTATELGALALAEVQRNPPPPMSDALLAKVRALVAPAAVPGRRSL